MNVGAVAALLGTARSWRGIVPFTHLAWEGRMTVTIGRRELLAALGGAAAACGSDLCGHRRVGIGAKDDPRSHRGASRGAN
jgi:hypothetical protein